MSNLNSNSDIVWRLEGPFDSSYSLALLNREISRALGARGVNVALFSTEGPGDFEPSQDFLDVNPDLKSMNELCEKYGHSTASIVSRNLYPPRVEDMSCSLNIMHSYAWEESAFPQKWVKNFNIHLSGLTCLSSHVLKVMQDNGVSVPMSVSGCGIDHWERVIAAEHSILDEKRAKGFRFLHVSSCFPRKGARALLEAYGQAFSSSDDVTLVIKTFANPHNQVYDWLRQAKDKFQNYPDVIIICDDLSDGELKALYQRCHVLVAPSCAEGFGLPLAEAMLSGMPVITTAWSGQMDFCNEDNSWLVDYQYEQADTHFNLRPSAWAAIDVDDLAAAMKTAFATDPEKRVAMAKSGRELLLRDFTWSGVADRLVDFYHKLAAWEERLPKVGWITTWNTKCGIATYSEHLISCMGQKPFVLAARTDATLRPDDDSFRRCWTVSDDDDLNELRAVIEERGLNTIVIQLNFGFFHHDHLHKLVQSLKLSGCIVVIDMHATVDPPQAPHKKLKNFVPALALADRLLLHSIADMNRLKTLSLTNNLTLFPHGVLDLSVPAKPALSIPTIATYGFCLPHKGLEQVVEAISLLKSRGVRVDLRMVNAEYPIDFSAKLASDIRKRISDLGLNDQITLESKFLTDNESLEILQNTDLVLFVYHPTSESASGAVRYGLSIGKPTLVTDLPIFDEFGDAVWRVADTSPKLLASALEDILLKVRSNSNEHQRKLGLANDWSAQHRYSWLSIRLEGLLKSLLNAPAAI